MSGNRVLIIDADTAARTCLIEDVVRPAGYVIAEANTLDQAHAQVAQFRPNVIVLDAQLDDSDWHFVCTYEANTPIVLTTDQPSLDHVLSALRAGARDVLLRPYSKEDMAQALTRAFRIAHIMRDRDILREQTERHAQEVNALYTIGRHLTNLLDLEGILSQVISAAIDLTRAEEGALMLVDANSGELFLRANKTIDSKISHNLHVKIDDVLMSKVIESRAPIVLNSKDLKKIKTSFAAQAMLCVPMIAGARVAGVLSVNNTRNARRFTQDDVHILSLLADYAAIALENAHLFWSAENERLKLQSVLRNMEEALLVVDTDMRIVLINGAARKAFNVRGPGDGALLTEAIDNRALLELFDQRWRQERNARAEVPLADGRMLQGQLSMLPGIGFAAVLQDITHLKELDRVKSEFMSILSHDLRSPLTSIRGYVELLPRAGPLNNQQQHFIDNVERNITNIVQLINDLLDISRIEAGLDWEMDAVAVHELIREVATSLQPNLDDKAQTLQLDVPDMPQVLGHARRLQQVVSNLIGNAIKYTPDGGLISVRLIESNEFLTLTVKDSGIGISQADQARIFEKFFRVESDDTAEISGTGLGLSIVKSIVDRHHGRVWAESEGPGKGSTFSVLLPRFTR